MVGRSIWLLTLLALASLAAPVRGADPRLSLRLTHVTCRQALRELEKATGVPLTLSPLVEGFVTRAAEAARRPSLEEPADFNWSGVTLSQALRQLAARYQVGMYGSAGGYTIQSLPLPPLPSAPASSVTKAGFRVGVERVTVQRTRNAPGATGSLSVVLSVQAVGDGPGIDSLWELDNFLARDDRGNLIPLRSFSGPLGAAAPDTVMYSCEGIAPDPAATRLSWLECDLSTARHVRRVDLEAPLPLPKEGLTTQRDGIRLELRSFSPGETLKAPPADVKEVIYAQEHGGVLDGSFTAPAVGGRLEAPNSPKSWPSPCLRGASGKLYAGGSHRASRTSGIQEPDQYRVSWGFFAAPEPFTHVIFPMIWKTDPDHTASFHLRDIPLPRDGSPDPKQGAPAGKTLDPEHPLYQADGATLVHQVTLQGRPAAGGRLLVRLSDPAQPAANPLQWLTCEVDASGLARLGPIKPGAYRMLRTYQPPSGVALPRGVWQGSDLPVTASKDTADKPIPLALAPPGPVKPIPPAPPVRAGAGPVTVTGASVEMRVQESLRFTEPVEHETYIMSTLHLQGRTQAEDAERIRGIQNFVACDDGGRLTTGVGSPGQPGAQWATSLNLRGIRPDAKWLEWIEGDVVAWKSVAPLHVEFPAEPSEKPARKELQGVRFEIQAYRPPAATAAPGEGPFLRAVIASPPETELRGAGRRVQAALVGQSGKTYDQMNGSASTEVGGEGSRCRIEGTFRNVMEPIVAVRFDAVLYSQPGIVQSFRLTHIPLPEDRFPAFPRESPRAGRLGARHPLYAEGGGSLVLPVRIDGKAVVDGTLSVGLSAEGGPVRWLEAEVKEDGAARLELLKPGTYRVLRLFRPLGTLSVGAGEWRHAEEQVTVTAGKSVTLPALEWVTAASGKP